VLDARKDGLVQVAAVLAKRSGIDEVHVPLGMLARA
jgi:hypothetical protein